MLLASVALVVVLLAGWLLLVAGRSLGRAEAELRAARRREMRYRAWAAERRRLLEARTAIADATTSTASAVQLGAEVTQASHQAVAEIPFGILEAIPGTREGSKRVRGVHDNIAGAVYGSISAATEGLARLSRQRLTGGEVTPPGEVGSGPPAPPTQPEAPHG